MRKKLSSIICFVLSLLVTCSALPMNISAAEPEEDKIFEVYDGYGNLVYEANSIEEAEEYIGNALGLTNDPTVDGENNVNGTRSAASFLKLCKFAGKFISGVATVLTVIDLIYTFSQYCNNEATLYDVIDTVVPISVLEKLASNGGKAYLYGSNSFNPYPPHSYQGATWVRTNHYYVVE